MIRYAKCFRRGSSGMSESSHGNAHGGGTALLAKLACRWLLAAATAHAAIPLAAAQQSRPGLTEPPIASYVGEKACAGCHASESKHFGHTVHSLAFRLNPRNERERQVCEACHGPGSAHLKDATDRSAIIGFTRGWGTPVEKQNAQCMPCHQGGQRIHWPGSAHASNQLGCSDCHNAMARFSAGGLLAKPTVSETCYGCHPQQRAEFRKRSHMPLPEGKLSCTDCHNPHGSQTPTMLKADTINDTCYACHAEKRGPFVWEHAQGRENCLNCHQPHGSNHDALLVTIRSFLCEQCHSPRSHLNQLLTTPNLGGGASPQERLIGRGCQTCHSQIHGSNHPGGVRMHR